MEDREIFKTRMTKTYPLLYSDMDGDPRETLMAFGFDIGPGWFPIIEELSGKLEEVIKPIYNKVIENPNGLCERCAHKKKWHWFFYIITAIVYFFKNKKKAIKELSKNIKRTQSSKYSFFKRVMFVFKYRWFIACRKFKPCYPRAAQVKEKFGNLRFYMSYWNEEIEALINKAEEKSAITCERCGNPGEERTGGWLVTLCDSCNEKK